MSSIGFIAGMSSNKKPAVIRFRSHFQSQNSRKSVDPLTTNRLPRLLGLSTNTRLTVSRCTRGGRRSSAPAEQYGIKAIFLWPANLIAPGRQFRPAYVASHSCPHPEISRRGIVALVLKRRWAQSPSRSSWRIPARGSGHNRRSSEHFAWRWQDGRVPEYGLLKNRPGKSRRSRTHCQPAGSGLCDLYLRLDRQTERRAGDAFQPSEPSILGREVIRQRGAGLGPSPFLDLFRPDHHRPLNTAADTPKQARKCKIIAETTRHSNIRSSVTRHKYGFDIPAEQWQCATARQRQTPTVAMQPNDG